MLCVLAQLWMRAEYGRLQQMPSSTHPDKQESAADCRLSGPGAQTRADSVYLISPAGAIEDLIAQGHRRWRHCRRPRP
ncbi:MAG: hypothetical protein EBW73_04755, partial [Betaproteobacteria bacterium]|nr:hypothetical protein [Betaproteobacteria bacterium]